MQKKIFVYIQAYNAEKTLGKAIESILQQTYNDFLLYICDNGSVDKTKEIIMKYQERDARIESLFLQKNDSEVLFHTVLPRVCYYYGKFDYFCTLDADDEYYPEFMKETLCFAEEQNVDLAICGSDFVSIKTKKIVGQRRVNNEVRISGDKFSSLFPIYHQFMRTIWGKLYRISLIQAMDYHRCNVLRYGGDTLFAQEAFRRSTRVGIMNKVLHRYYLSDKTSSYSFQEDRIYSDAYLFESTQNYLLRKCNEINSVNQQFLYEMHACAIQDTLNVLLRSSLNNSEKLCYVHKIMTNIHVREMFCFRKKAEEYKAIAVWLIEKGLGASEKELNQIAETLAIIEICPTEIKNYSTGALLDLQLRIYEYTPKRTDTFDITKSIFQTVQKSILLIKCSVEFLIHYKEICIDVLENKYIDALQKILLVLQQESVITQHTLELIDLGLNVCSLQNEDEIFITLKKVQIEVLICLGQIEKADMELKEWENIFPVDEDFQRLRQEL